MFAWLKGKKFNGWGRAETPVDEMTIVKQNIAKSGQTMSSLIKLFYQRLFKNHLSSGKISVLIFKSASAILFFVLKKM